MHGFTLVRARAHERTVKRKTHIYIYRPIIISLSLNIKWNMTSDENTKSRYQHTSCDSCISIMYVQNILCVCVCVAAVHYYKIKTIQQA